MNSKKAALVYNWTLTFMVIGILAWAFLQFGSKHSLGSLGTKQMTIFKIYSMAESALFYIDQSAKYALQQAVYDLAQNGVSVSDFELNEININLPFEKNKCGKFKDAYVWYELSKGTSGNILKNDCFDSNPLITNLKFTFDKKLNDYLSLSPYNIRINNYDYDASGSIEIIGKARTPLIFDILKDETKPIIIKEPVEVQVEQKKFSDFSTQELKMCAKGVKCVLSEDAFKLMVKAQEIAATKYKRKLVVNSALRTQEEQIAIWNKFAATYPDVTERRKKICDPNNLKCPHTTGNAVDVVFEGKTTKTMTNNDWLILHEIMTGVKNDKGEPLWVRYGEEKRYDIGEPWHFECCGTDRHKRAQAKGVTAIV
jgi:hypothetical protein